MDERTTKNEKKDRNIWLKLVFSINLFMALLLLCCQTAMRISPEKLWILQPLSNTFPVLLLINLLFVMFWTSRKSRLAFLSAAVILIGHDKCSQLYRPGLFKVEVMQPKNAFKVLSYNVRLFDLYNWTGNLETRASIFKFFKQEQPDILCIQEYFHDDKGNFQNNDTIKKLINANFGTIKYSITLRKTSHWGLATFSKFPILNEGTVFYEAGKSNFCIYSDLDINNKTVRVYNAHFQSNHFKQEEYEFLEYPDSLESNNNKLKNTKNILRRIKKAAIKRSQQVDELKLHMAACPYPIILCGDFNDTPFSYTYQTLKNDLDDSFIEKGEGFGSTYIKLPINFRIDYILHSPNIQTHSFRVKNGKLSDHYPIQSWLSIP